MSRRIKEQRVARARMNELLNALVPLLRVQPMIEDFCRFGGNWRSPHSPSGRGSAQFHIVTRGTCVIERQGLGKLSLKAGDILLLPHGDSHVVRSRVRGVPCAILTKYRNGIRQRTTVDARSDTELLCGRLIFEMAEENPLLAALPDEIVIRTASKPQLERFRILLSEIRDELDCGRVGSEVVAADFARALFVLMLRDYLECNPKGNETVSLLQDRTTARVVLAILDDLSRDWTLDNLKEIAVTSRATLVRAFRKHAGVTPMTFLSDLRLAAARQRLAGTLGTIANIAAEVGYASEGALSKAILRKYGVRPGALRLQRD